MLGGLRPGRGEPWNDHMKSFLRHHWQEVNTRSGQPFSYDLLELESYDYDTEPACRAMVDYRSLKQANDLEFFESIQCSFYAESQDPKSAEFYRPICESFNIDFETFLSLWNSEPIKQQTQKEFMTVREWGIRGYPSVVFKHGKDLHLIAGGYTTFGKKTRISEIADQSVNQPRN